MTKDELNNYRWLVKDILEIKDEIDELRARAERVNQSISDMPKAENNNSDKICIYSIKIVEKEKELKEKEVKEKREREKIIDFLNTISDTLVRQILQYRFLNLLTWKKVAYFVGGGNTDESVRKIAERFLKK